MDKQQTEYLLKNHKTQSEKELAINLHMGRKELRLELRRVLAEPKKESGESCDREKAQPMLSPVFVGLEEWLAGKEWYVFFSLIFLIGAFVFRDFFLLRKVYFFKDIGSDSLNLTYPLLVHLSNYLRSDGFPQWSFNSGMGQNIYPGMLGGTFFGFLLVLPGSIIAQGVFFAEFIKIVLAGFFFFLYLRMLSLSRFTSIVGSIMFAYSGYIVLGGCWAIFSIEAVCAALLLYAFEKYFQQKSWFLFPIAIALLSMLQPFFLYLYSVFLIIYGTFRFFDAAPSAHPKWLPLFARLAGLGLLGMAIGSVFMFSNILQLLESPRGSGAASYFKLLFSQPLFHFAPYIENVTAILRFFSNDMLGTGSSFKGAYNYLEAPMFYCGLPNLLLLPQIFCFLSPRRKKLYAFMILLWGLPVIFPWFRHLFWGFTGDYYRSYSLFVTIFLLFFSLNALNYIEKTSQLNRVVLLVTLGVLLCLLFFPYFNVDNPVSVKWSAYAAVFLIGYAQLIYLMARANDKRRSMFYFICLLAVELACFSFITVNHRDVLTRQELHQKVGYNDYSVEAIAYLKSIDQSFFRVGKYYASGPAIHRSLNDGLAQGYKGISSYHPFNQFYYIKFLDELGVINASDEHATRWAAGLETRPLLQTVLSVKYALAKDAGIVRILESAYHLIYRVGDVSILQNNSFLPLGFTYDAFLPLEEFKRMSKDQKDLVLLRACVIDKKDEEKFEGLYLFGVKDLKVSVTHEEYRSYVADLGAEVLSIAQQSQNYIKGTITLRQKRVLFLSIPYDSGWMIRVDGKKIKPYILNIGFMGFPLEPGKHTVELQYRSPWLIAGGMVSLAGIFLYFFLIRGFRKMSSNSIPE